MKNNRKNPLLAAFISLAFTAPFAFAADTDGTWNADADGNWSDAANWTSSTVADGVGFTATLGDFITVDRIITLDSARSIGNITTLDATNNFTISGANILTLDVNSGSPTINTLQDRTLTINSVIDGNEGLTKTSSGITTGTLILGGDNTYTGDTIVNAGTLAVTHNNALGSTTGKTIINGGNGNTGFILSLSSASTDLTIDEDIDFIANAVGRAVLTNDSAQNHTLNGAISVTGIAPNLTQFVSTGAGSITVNGDITSGVGNNTSLFVRGSSTSATNQLLGSVNIVGGGFTKTDAGIWLVGAAGKTYSWGATSVTNGTLKMGKADLLPVATTLTVGQTSNNSATFDLNGFNQTVAGIVNGSGNGTKRITASSPAVLTLDSSSDSTPAGSATNIFLLSGSLGLTKKGTGRLTLPGANTYTGATTLEGGTLALANATPLGTIPGTDGTSAISMSSGAALQSNTAGANPSTTIAAPITLSGVGDATFRIGQGAGSNVHTFNLNGAIGGTTGNVVYTTTTNSFNNGSSVFVLGAAGTYSGNTLITTGNGGNNPVILKAGTGVVNALPVTTVLTFDGVTGGGTGRPFQYDLAGNDQTLAGLTNTVAALRRVNVTSTNPATLTINNTADYSFGGAHYNLANDATNRTQITGAISLTKSGVGTFTLGGTLLDGATEQGNTFTGSTKVLAGILNLGETTSLRNSAFDTLNSVTGNAANGLRSSVTTLTLGGLTGNKNFASVFTTTAGGYTGLTALTLNPGTGVTHSYSADIGNGNGSLSLTKTGAGTQNLTSANTYTGNTTINEGTLSVSAPNFADASTVSIGTLATPGIAFLNLPNAGNDNVAALIIDGVTQPVGKTYGNSSSVLPIIATSAITGPGTITVPGAGTPYSLWADTFLPGNDVSNPVGDNDGDGLVNQQEFAFGLSPISGSSVNPILVHVSKTAGTFTYQRRAGTGLTYKILTSPDLVTWTHDATAGQAATPSGSNETVVVTLTGTKPLAATKLFVRVAAQ